MLQQFRADISQSQELSDSYRFTVLGQGDKFFPGSKITYREIIELHARCCYCDYVLLFPTDRDRENYEPKKLIDPRVEKPQKLKRKSKRPSDKLSIKRKKKCTKILDNSTNLSIELG